VSVDLPSTALEEKLGQTATTIVLPACSPTVTSFQLSAVSMSTNLYPGQLFTSNPVSLSVSSIACSDWNNCNLGLSFASDNVGIGLSFESVNRTVNCLDADTTNHTVSCPNHKNYTVACRGKRETIVFHCPRVSLVQRCHNLDIETGELTANDCKTTAEEGSDMTTCSCPAKSVSQWNNKNDGIAAARSSDFTYVTLLESVEENFVQTILSAQALDESVFQKSYQAIITILLLMISIGGGMIYAYRTDCKERRRESPGTCQGSFHLSKESSKSKTYPERRRRRRR
jgi:hypothetical protein